MNKNLAKNLVKRGLRSLIITIFVAFIGSVALVVTFEHGRELLLYLGETTRNAMLLPATVESLMVISSFKLRSTESKITKRIARICLWSALAVSALINASIGLIHFAAAGHVDTVILPGMITFTVEAKLTLSIIGSVIPVAALFGAAELLTHRRATPARKPSQKATAARSRPVKSPAKARQRKPVEATPALEPALAL